jgi:iron complex outermembrane recepter protein
VLYSVTAAAVALARQEPATQGSEDSSHQEKSREKHPREVTEAGGRLVISETVEVTASVDEPVHDSSIATKTDTPLLETPRSVTVFDRGTLDEMQTIDISQTHDYAVGVIPQDERGPGFARGFPIGFYELRRDGLRTYSWSVREPAALDRIQYLRGPASVLYGDGSPGGMVNLVLKKPLPVPRYEATFAAGELGFLRFTGDATGPMTAGGGARYRVVAAAEGLDDGFSNDERRMTLFPMFSFELGRESTLHVDSELYDQKGRGYRHAVPVTVEGQAGDFSGLPWDLNMASPDDVWSGWNVSSGARFDGRLARNATIHAAGRFTHIGGDLAFQFLVGLAPDGRTAQRASYRERSAWDEIQSDVFVVLDERTGSVGHQIVAGMELGSSTTDTELGVGSAPSLDIYDPVYGPPPPEPQTSPVRNDTLRTGGYLQDQIRLSQRWIAVPAVRFSQIRVEDEIAAPGKHATTNVVSPSLGFVFLPRPWLSFYGTATTGFEPPQPGQFADGGGLLDPIRSRSLEAGVKTEFLHGRLDLSGATYEIRQTNVAEADSRGFFQQIGEGKSHGVELEVSGSPTRGLRLQGGIAWMETSITRDVSGFVGNELPNAPNVDASLWGRYRFSSGALARLSLAGGVVHVGPRFASRDNGVRFPAYTRIDTTASFDLLSNEKVALAVAVENLANVRYVTSGSSVAMFAGAPRRISVTLGSSF